MRLRWPFGRSTAAEDANDSDPHAANESPGGGTTDGGQRPAPPAGPPAWQSLPPIQRAVGSAPLVAPSGPFLAGVPGARPLPPIVEPLGHDVTTLAPAGLVAAPAHGVPSLTSHANLVPPPVQRRTAAAAETAGEAATSPAQPAPAPSIAEASPRPSDGTVSVAGSAEAPIRSRQLAVVAPAATVQPPDRSLTRAAAPVAIGAVGAAATGAGDRPLVARRTNAPSSVAPVSSASAGASAASAAPARHQSTDVERPRRGLGEALPAAPPTAVQASLARPLPMAGLPGAPATGGASRGFGPAMQATTARDTATNPTAGSAPLRPTIQRRAAGSSPATETTHLDAAARDGDPTRGGDRAGPADSAASIAHSARSLPVLRAVDAAARGRSASADAGGTASTGAADPLVPASWGTPAAPSPQRRPLAGSQGISSLTSIQRSPDDGGDAAEDAFAGPSSAWAFHDPLASVAGSGSASPFGAEPSFSSASPFAATSFGGAAPTAVQRQAGAGAARARPGPSATSAASVRAGTTGGPAGPAVRQPGSSMTLAHPTAASASGGAATATLPLPIVARSSGAVPAAPASAPAPVPARAAAPVLAPTATAIVQRVEGAAPPAPAESAGAGSHSDDELDDLARALFGRFRTRLRNEFIYEREAKGLTFDS